ncbi:hypothetical protein O7W59_005570, partial [Escherichia coli]|nr:hypothetical protein [Escherichia coli]
IILHSSRLSQRAVRITKYRHTFQLILTPRTDSRHWCDYPKNGAGTPYNNVKEY